MEHPGHGLQSHAALDSAETSGDPSHDFLCELELADEDHVFWAGVYLDGQRPAHSVAGGEHELEIELGVVSGQGPTQGHRFEVKTAQKVRLAEGHTEIRVRLARTEGQLPFRLQVSTSWQAAMTMGALSFIDGSYAVGGLGATTGPKPSDQRYDLPARTDQRPFQPPAELLDAGAHAVRVANWINRDGKVVAMEIAPGRGAQALNPRLLGATLDWLRSFHYQAPARWDPEAAVICELFTVPFDEASVPAPRREMTGRRSPAAWRSGPGSPGR